MFKYRNNDRFIPSRNETTSEFLKKTSLDCFDVSSSSNGMKTMKKVQYQNHLRKLFLDNNDRNKGENEETIVKKKSPPIKLVHRDWACNIPDMRLKFLPDFETLKKPGFGFISKLRIRLFEK